jgi:hypothetical protein
LGPLEEFGPFEEFGVWEMKFVPFSDAVKKLNGHHVLQEMK